MIHALLFEDRFADLVASGRKAQTIRRLPPVLPKVGDHRELWQPHPTLLRQLIRDDVVCTSVQPIRIYRDVDGIAVDISDAWQDQGQIAALARADGFNNTVDFLRYFERKGLPFEGVLIKWEVRPVHPHIQPPAPVCGTCKHEGKGLEDWPCRTSMSPAGLICWEPKEAHHGTART